MRRVVLVVGILVSARAGAQPADVAPDVEIARRHFELGSSRYALGDYAGALEEFEAARKVSPAPALDFNIARCYDRMEHPAEAIAAYRRYLGSVPPPPDADEVQQRIRELEPRVAAQPRPRPAPPPVAPVESAKDSGHAARIAGITVGALGIASLVAGLAAGVLAQEAGDELSRLDQTRPRVQFDPSKEDAGKTEQILEGLFLGVGAAALVAGVVLYALGQRAAHRRVAWTSQGAGLWVRF